MAIRLFVVVEMIESGRNLSNLFAYRYSEKQFTQSHMATIGLDYVSTTYRSPNAEDIAVKIWDTAGQERFKTITYSFYKQAHGVIVTFDVTNQLSFTNVKTWLESIY